jgi:hypothetical protein
VFYDPSGKPGTTKTQHGYFLNEDLTNLDKSFFSMPRKEVEQIEPQQRLVIDEARESFEEGGERDWRGKNIGCYFGNLYYDWPKMLGQDIQNFGIYRISGYCDFSLSNHISYEMNLQGARYVRCHFVDALEAMIRRAYEVAGFTASDSGYLSAMELVHRWVTLSRPRPWPASLVK